MKQSSSLQRNRRKSFQVFYEPQSEKKSNFEDPVKISEEINSDQNASYKKIEKSLKTIDIVISIIAIVNVSLTIWDSEYYISNTYVYLNEYMKMTNKTYIDNEVLDKTDSRPISIEENSLRYICLVLMLVNLGVIIFHYYSKINLLKDIGVLSKFDNLWTSGLYKWMVLEILICSVFTPPNLNKAISLSSLGYVKSYNVSNLISVFVVFKFYIVFRMYTYYSMWSSDVSNSIRKKYNIEPGVYFNIKSELKKRPFYFIMFFFIIILAFLGWFLRSVEYGVINEKGNNAGGTNDLEYLPNSLWLIVVTMTTVGYGDITPKSHLGRLICVIACITGMVFVSLSVVSMTVISEFNEEEKKAYSLIKKNQADEQNMQKGIGVIQAFLTLRKAFYYRKNKTAAYQISNRFAMLMKLKKQTNDFSISNKVAINYSLPLDEMLRVLEVKFKKNINNMKENLTNFEKISYEYKNILDSQEIMRKETDTLEKKQEDIMNYLFSFNKMRYAENKLNKKNSIKSIQAQISSTKDTTNNTGNTRETKEIIKGSFNLANKKNSFLNTKPIEKNMYSYQGSKNPVNNCIKNEDISSKDRRIKSNPDVFNS